jgi:hypothetical protein
MQHRIDKISQESFHYLQQHLPLLIRITRFYYQKINAENSPVTPK